MANLKPTDDDQAKLAKAKLALSDEKEVEKWKKSAEYLNKRREEAAKALASDDQKKAWAEEEKKKTDRLNAQKKLAELEAARKIEEANKGKKIAEEQKKKDEETEKKRQEKIKEILASQEEIGQIKKGATSGLTPIRTFTRDISQAVKQEGLTASKIATTLSDKDKKLSPAPKASRTWLVGVGVLLVIISLSVILWAIIQKRVISLAPVEPTRQGLIFANNQIHIDLNNKNADQVRLEISQPFTEALSGKELIKEIYFTRQIKETTDQGIVLKTIEADFSALANLLSLNLPDKFLRFLDSRWLLGLYESNQIKPFYLFKTKSYSNTADILLSDENTIVANLLEPLLDSTTIEKIKINRFQDKMINNYDTRLVIDETNTVIALYAWLDKSTLIVTTDEATFAKILGLYINPKTLTN